VTYAYAEVKAVQNCSHAFRFIICIVASSDHLAGRVLADGSVQGFSNRRAKTVFQQCPMLGTIRIRPDVRKADAPVVKADIRAIRRVSSRQRIYQCARCGHALSRCGPCSPLRRS
jgi:hypothetical protein